MKLFSLDRLCAKILKKISFLFLIFFSTQIDCFGVGDYDALVRIETNDENHIYSARDNTDNSEKFHFKARIKKDRAKKMRNGNLQFSLDIIPVSEVAGRLVEAPSIEIFYTIKKDKLLNYTFDINIDLGRYHSLEWDVIRTRYQNCEWDKINIKIEPCVLISTTTNTANFGVISWMNDHLISSNEPEIVCNFKVLKNTVAFITSENNFCMKRVKTASAKKDDSIAYIVNADGRQITSFDNEIKIDANKVETRLQLKLVQHQPLKFDGEYKDKLTIRLSTNQ